MLPASYVVGADFNASAIDISLGEELVREEPAAGGEVDPGVVGLLEEASRTAQSRRPRRRLEQHGERDAAIEAQAEGSGSRLLRPRRRASPGRRAADGAARRRPAATRRRRHRAGRRSSPGRVRRTVRTGSDGPDRAPLPVAQVVPSLVPGSAQFASSSSTKPTSLRRSLARWHVAAARSSSYSSRALSRHGGHR